MLLTRSYPPPVSLFFDGSADRLWPIDACKDMRGMGEATGKEGAEDRNVGKGTEGKIADKRRSGKPVLLERESAKNDGKAVGKRKRLGITVFQPRLKVCTFARTNYYEYGKQRQVQESP